MSAENPTTHKPQARPEETHITVLIADLKMALKILGELSHIMIPYNSDPLISANTAIMNMRQKALLLEIRISSMLECKRNDE